jgi:regulator of sirC expression with transglutaminase-like and TPR domain
MTWTDNHREIDALVSLMDEPNDEIFAEIRTKVISHGSKAIPVLEEAWLHTFSGLHSKRLELAIEEIKFHETVSGVFNWLDDNTSETADLIHIISYYINEHYQTEHQQKWINQLYRDCWLELNKSLTALERIKVINHVFYQVYGLKNFLPDQNQFEAFFFDHMQHHKKGNALLIGLLYLTIAQRLKLPLSGINLPSQFVLAYTSSEGLDMEAENEKTKQNDVLFYINPSNEGAIFTKNEIKGYLNHLEISEKAEHFLPCTRRILCLRYLSEIHEGLTHENRTLKAKYIQSLIQILSEAPDQTGNSIS